MIRRQAPHGYMSGRILLIFLGGMFLSALCQSAQSAEPKDDKTSDTTESVGIRVGNAFFQKSTYFSDPALGRVTDLRLGAFLPRPGSVLAVVSPASAFFLDAAGKPANSISFKTRLDHTEIILIKPPNVYGFLNRGSWAIAPSLLDIQGNELWQYHTGFLGAADDMCAGDLNGDGLPEFAVGMNGAGGVHLLDGQGKELWSKKGANIWHTEIGKVTQDGAIRLVHSDAAGKMTIRDAAGTVVKQSTTATYFSDFSLCPYPKETSRVHCLVADQNMILLLDENGSTVAKFSAPGSGNLASARGILAQLKENEDPSLAVIVDFKNKGRAAFYVYNPAGQLVYEEVLSESCEAIKKLRNEKTHIDQILVGGNGRVYGYQPASPQGPTGPGSVQKISKN